MPKEIKQKIVLEGEKEYSAQLKAANRNLKTLQSQLKAETAELGKNASAQQKAELKTKSLQEQIKEQEKIVETLKEALGEVREKYADNEDEIAKWEQKLNTARATLANTKNELASVGGELNGIAQDGSTAVTAANSLADSLERVGNMGGAISGAVESAMTGAVGAVKSAVTAIWGDLAELAAKTNNYEDLAAMWNTDIQMISKYSGAVRAASGDLSDLNSLVAKINSVDPKKIAELTGVSDVIYEDRWEYAMAVMDSLSGMKPNQRMKAGFEIFGKGATKMFDLANDWDKVQGALSEFDGDKGGFGLTSDEYQLMSNYYDLLNKTQEKWERLKEMGEVKLFGQLAMDITGNAEAILDSLLKYFNAEDDETREAALAEMEAKIVDTFERVKKAIETGIGKLDELAEQLKGSENPTVQAVGNILGGIVDALQWITEDNMQHVVDGLKILAGFWIAGEGMQLVAKLAEFAASLKTIQTFKMTKSLTTFLKGGAGGAAAEAGAAGAAGAAAGAGASKVGWGSALFGAMRAGIPNVLAAWGVHEGVKALPANTMTIMAKALGLDTETQETVDRINAERGINTFGDLEEEIKNTPQEQNQRAMRLMLDTLLHPGANTATGGGASHEFGSEIAEAIKEVVEDVDLDREYTDGDRENAFQDWWDAWRNADQGLDSYEEEENAFAHMAEVFEDDFGDVWENINRMLDQIDNAGEMNDLPSSWWQQVTNNDPNRITSSDLQGFRNLPGMLQAAVQRGAAGGVSGIQVTLDGATVGRLVAPYVSQWIGYSIG